MRFAAGTFSHFHLQAFDLDKNRQVYRKEIKYLASVYKQLHLLEAKSFGILMFGLGEIQPEVLACAQIIKGQET